MARPPVEIDMQKLSVLMRYKPTAEDCAAFFKCSVDTIERRIRAETVSDDFPTGLSFADFRDQNMVHTRMNLIQTAIRKAEKGDNIMLIFCLKNLCHWADKQHVDVNAVMKNVSELTPEERKAEVEQLILERATAACES